MTVAQEAIINLLRIQANRAAIDYNAQLLNQMFAYYDEDDRRFNLLSLI